MKQLFAIRKRSLFKILSLILAAALMLSAGSLCVYAGSSAKAPSSAAQQSGSSSSDPAKQSDDGNRASGDDTGRDEPMPEDVKRDTVTIARILQDGFLKLMKMVPARTKVKGWKTEVRKKAGKELTLKISVNVPDGRKAELQMRKNGKWVRRKILKLPAGSDWEKILIKFPGSWWNEKQKFRLVISKSRHAGKYVSKTLTVTPERYYQNPEGYIQISNKISTHGYGYYTSPVLVGNTSTRSDHVEALIRTAYKYKGDPFWNRHAGAPGTGGVDCSGLVMQSCYGAGVDLWPSNPYRHQYGAARYEWESREIARMSGLKTVSYSQRRRGDLIFFCDSGGTVIHVAIYLGGNQIIHSTSVGNHVVVSGMGGGAYGRICRVRRIFN